jgi:hypothetical protein
MEAIDVPASDRLSWRLSAATASVCRCVSYIPQEHCSTQPDDKQIERPESRFETRGPN